MRNTKLLVWPMVLMLGLLSMGIAYAHWSQILDIEGSVASGDLDWEFADWSAEDTVPGENDYNCRDNFAGPTPYKWQVDKDVGRTTITRTDPHTITLTLTNVYPSYWTAVSVYAHCTGSTPLVIAAVLIDGIEITEGDPKIRLDLTGDDNYDIEIWWRESGVFGQQLENCDDSDEMSFWIHVLQDAPQDNTLEFTIGLVGVQWTEYP